jgi:Uncharacterized protein conserved in bacteria C-term(DUF2220)
MSQALALQALTRLLSRAERAALNKQGTRAITLPFTQASFAAYFALPTHAAKQELHATLREAQRAGAIEIEWDPLAGDDGQIKRILLKDLGTLAQHLGIQTHQSVLEHAKFRLTAWSTLPQVQEILHAWANLRTVRGRAPSEVPDLIDALRVLDFCRARAGDDIAVRTVSAALFKNSKRLEELEQWLDILTAEDLQGLRRPAGEVFAGLGLVKHPPAVYLSGCAEMELADGLRLQVPSPFVALAPKSVVRVLPAQSVHTVLTVENLTVFHELAAGRAGSLEAHLVLFTAGMPAPSFMAFYDRLLQQLGDRHLYHWGDIDPGGFRIAACLARATARVGCRLSLWQMDSSRFEPDLAYRRLSRTDISEMRRICGNYGWAKEGAALEVSNHGFEQEALPALLPP